MAPSSKYMVAPFTGGTAGRSSGRAYYTMFYAALGLLAVRQLGSSKHAGVLSLFGRHFVNTGEFSPSTALHLREAFELRQKCDYREFVEPEEDQARELLTYAEQFLQEADQAWLRLTEGGSA